MSTATILTDPAMLEDYPDEAAFWVDPTQVSGPELGVRLLIDGVIDPPIGRDRLETDDVLAGLPNLRFRNATNYRLEPEQVVRIFGHARHR